MHTLIQVQERALAKLDVSRSSELRYRKLQGSVYFWYIAEVAKLGITNKLPTRLAAATWRDVLDMAVLRKGAE